MPLLIAPVATVPDFVLHFASARKLNPRCDSLVPRTSHFRLVWFVSDWCHNTGPAGARRFSPRHERMERRTNAGRHRDGTRRRARHRRCRTSITSPLTSPRKTAGSKPIRGCISTSRRPMPPSSIKSRSGSASSAARRLHPPASRASPSCGRPSMTSSPPTTQRPTTLPGQRSKSAKRKFPINTRT